MYLTFDWDDIESNDPIVESALQELTTRFGYGNIWYRISSSGEGIHVIIAALKWNGEQGKMEMEPTDFERDYTLLIRKEFADPPWGLECKGRLISDSVRVKHGFRTGRLFSAKSQHWSETHTSWTNFAGEWKMYE